MKTDEQRAKSRELGGIVGGICFIAIGAIFGGFYVGQGIGYLVFRLTDLL